MDELSDDDKLTVARARKIQRFLSQPFQVSGSKAPLTSSNLATGLRCRRKGHFCVVFYAYRYIRRIGKSAKVLDSLDQH